MIRFSKSYGLSHELIVKNEELLLISQRAKVKEKQVLLEKQISPKQQTVENPWPFRQTTNCGSNRPASLTVSSARRLFLVS